MTGNGDRLAEARKYGFDAVRSASGDEVVCRCPRCPPGKAPKLYLNLRLGVWWCFRCQRGGRARKGTCPGAPVRVRREAGGAGVDLEREWSVMGPIVGCGVAARLAREYVRRRVPDASGFEGQLRVARLLGGLYVVFRIEELREGRLVGLTGRRFGGSGPKHMTVAGSRKSGGFVRFGPVSSGRCVLVEGPFDALAGHARVPQVAWLAVAGSEVSIAQVGGLAAAGLGRVAVTFDPDVPGRASAVARRLGLVCEAATVAAARDVDELGAGDPYWGRLREFLSRGGEDALRRPHAGDPDQALAGGREVRAP